MATHRIYLNKDSNPEYYNLVEDFNLLMDRWNICNNKVRKFRIPRIPGQVYGQYSPCQNYRKKL